MEDQVAAIEGERRIGVAEELLAGWRCRAKDSSHRVGKALVTHEWAQQGADVGVAQQALLQQRPVQLRQQTSIQERH